MQLILSSRAKLAELPKTVKSRRNFHGHETEQLSQQKIITQLRPSQHYLCHQFQHQVNLFWRISQVFDEEMEGWPLGLPMPKLP
jgi:hypothetical protein